jgi:hypothetical protein
MERLSIYRYTAQTSPQYATCLTGHVAVAPFAWHASQTGGRARSSNPEPDPAGITSSTRTCTRSVSTKDLRHGAVARSSARKPLSKSVCCCSRLLSRVSQHARVLTEPRNELLTSVSPRVSVQPRARAHARCSLPPHAHSQRSRRGQRRVPWPAWAAHTSALRGACTAPPHHP